jgi:NAD+ synthase
MISKIDKITNWLKNYANGIGYKGFIIGLSGGIDSAVAASLAIRAVGKENVHGIILPCTYTNERFRTEDIEDAKLLAKSFGIDYEILQLDVPATSIFDDIKSISVMESNLVLSNIKARLRMTTLRAYAEARHCLVLGTTNKTEEYLGYYTKAGDGGAGVDVEPIADLFKYEVFQMARDLKNIPDKIINRQPSAGLFDNQTDESEIGITYAEIDRYLEFRENVTNSYGVDKYKDASDIVICASKFRDVEFETHLIEKIENMIVKNDHKRKNPPTIEL